jgi:hypothetical protein
VPNARQREAAAVAAGWSPPRDLSPEGKQFTATHPALYLHVWCNFSGVHVEAHVDHLDTSGRLRRVEVARALFRPSAVSERLVVEWGERALKAWLERELTPPHKGT